MIYTSFLLLEICVCVLYALRLAAEVFARYLSWFVLIAGGSVKLLRRYA